MLVVEWPLVLRAVVAGPSAKLLVLEKCAVPGTEAAGMAVAEKVGIGQAAKIRLDGDGCSQHLLNGGVEAA